MNNLTITEQHPVVRVTQELTDNKELITVVHKLTDEVLLKLECTPCKTISLVVDTDNPNNNPIIV